MLAITRNEISYYEQKCVWDRYEDNAEEIKRAESIIELIPADVRSVLDIGCGNGIVTNRISRPLVVGVDFARTPLRKVEAHAIQGSINFIPIKTGIFDLIIITEVLEHLDEPTYQKAINEINRLKSRYILISVPYKENIAIGLCKCVKCGHLFNASHHRRIFDENRIRDAFPKYKVEKVKYESYRIPPSSLLFKIRQNFGVYSYSQVALCDRCGSPPARPSTVYRYIFGGLNRMDRLLKSMLGIKKPYHLMVLMKRISQ